MAQHTEKPGIITTGLAGGTITSRRFVGFDDKVVSVFGGMAKGVAIDNADVGESFPEIISGTALVTTAVSLKAGNRVTSNAVGKAVLAIEGTYVNGIVMRDQPVPDELVEIMLTHGQGIPETTTSTTTTTTTTHA